MLTTRAFRLEDEPVVIRLWRECGLVVSHNDPARDISRKLKVDPHLFLVGEWAGALVSTCMAGYEGHRGWINCLAVAPSHQRRGIATRMLAHAEALLRELGCAKINLQVRSSNSAAMEFYRSIGFVQDEVASFGRRLVHDKPE